MPHFDGKHNPLNQLTPLLDPSPNEDSHNALTIDLWSLMPEKSPLQLLHTENMSAPSYIFAQTDFRQNNWVILHRPLTLDIMNPAF